ncbi:MAG: DUF2586 domain-containing protein, partial [Roseburia sp.]|nr:DUF2586 domain-containing protein [Roseburia sp.]
ESSVPLLITNTMKPDAIKEKLGCTPLADACMDAAENGLKENYAIPVPVDISGTVGEITHSGDGAGSISVEGNPNNAYQVVIEITETGSLNDGMFRYSLDGGNIYSEEQMIPLSGSYELPKTGLTIMFSGEENPQEFKEGDAYSFETTEPALNNQSVLKAVEKLKNSNISFEMVHIVGISGKALWAALQQEALEFLDTYKKPLIFLVEGRAVRDDETLDEYLAAMKEERRGINSIYICVSLSYGIYTRQDLSTKVINMAGVLSGLFGQAKESLSIGCVRDFSISSAKLLQLVPEGIGDYAKLFDDAGYTVFRQYTGLEDYYVSNAKTFASENSDFPYVENVRVLNRIVREVTKRATENIQQEIDPEEIETSVKGIESELNIAMDDCMDDKIISSGEVTIDTESVNILVDESLDVSAEWVPMGTARVFNIRFAVQNPYTATESE